MQARRERPVLLHRGHRHGRLKQSDKALDVFREMQEAGLTPNVVSCAPLAGPAAPLPALAHAPPTPPRSCAQTRPRSPHAGATATGRSRLAFSDMQTDGVADAYAINAAISACGPSGQWEEAEMLLQEMQALGLSPDRVTYNTAIAAAARGQWGRASGCSTRCAGRQPRRRVVVSAAMRACDKGGQPSAALRLFETRAGGPRGLGGDLQRGAARQRSALAARGHGRGSGRVRVDWPGPGGPGPGRTRTRTLTLT